MHPPGAPDPDKVRPLLNLVKAHEGEVLFFLKCYSSKCGCICFGTFLDGKKRCMAGYWAGLKALPPLISRTVAHAFLNMTPSALVAH